MKIQCKKTAIAFVVLITATLNSAAQKKLVLVTQSVLTGIAVPAGTKKDGRLLSEVAGKALLEAEAKKSGTSVTVIEILYLPNAGAGFTTDKLNNQLTALGWTATGPGTAAGYNWFSKEGRSVLAYLKDGNLYVGEAGNTAGQTVSTNAGIQNQQEQQQTAMPKPEQKSAQQAVTLAAANDGFAFSTTNFDDGWTSTIQNDWVLVSKGDIKVYLWYALPYNASDFSGTGVVDRDYYWDNYVSKYYTIETKQYKDNGEVMTSQKPLYVEGWATDKQTGEKRFIGMRLDIAPNTAYITIGSAKDEAALWQQFPKANGGAWSPSDLSNMGGYNKFAIGENDLLGTWQNSSSSSMQWYYTAASGNPGGYAGMTVAATSATFNFTTNGNYTSIHNGATGAVGALNTFQQNYKGKYIVANWSVTATNRWDGKTEQFNSWFKIIRGGRILCMDNGGMTYRLVKTK